MRKNPLGGPTAHPAGALTYPQTMTYGVRWAHSDEASTVAALLIAFNREFDTPAPEHAVLTDRVTQLLRHDTTWALVAGKPACALALVTVRTNVWHPGGVALLDELYVAPDRRGQGIGSAMMAELARRVRAEGIGLLEVNVDEPDVDAIRFYERNGFVATEPGSTDRAFYLWREMSSA